MNTNDSTNAALVKASEQTVAGLKRKPDWAAIKAAYLNGDGSFRELARQFNVSFHTIAKRAKREDWTGEMAKLCDAVATTAMNTATERGKELGFSAAEFVERSIKETETWLNRLESLANAGKLTADTAQKLVSSWRGVLSAGREAFNLDNQDRVTVCFGVELLSGRAVVFPALQPVLDVPSETKSESNPPP